jgi:hypothetical protein
MAKGPKGEKRKADVIGNAVLVMRIATGQESDNVAVERSKAAELGSRGGAARSKALSKKRRSQIAKAAAKKRWGG